MIEKIPMSSRSQTGDHSSIGLCLTRAELFGILLSFYVCDLLLGFFCPFMSVTLP